ncbi:MAG: endonuclease/exonuclease/phosphatase family protein [Alphaproteobacteria bacterium]|nr:endonuclease/exonuclease/phosphatase family protein [Alphaproteobacteria bacterium]
MVALLGCGGGTTDDRTDGPPTDAPTDGPTGETGETTTEETGGSTTGDDELVVLSLNLHCNKLDGTPYATNRERFDAVAALVEAEHVDVLLLQEVCIGAEDATALLDDALSAATGISWEGGWNFAHLAWEGTPDEAQEGVSVLSRTAPSALVPFAFFTPGQLPRVALAATVDGVTFVDVHLDLDEASRTDQASQAAAAALVLGGVETVVGGDFNDPVGGPALGATLLQGFEDATSALPADGIDHVVVHRGASWGAVAAERVLTSPPVSDHPGVLVRLARRTPPTVTLTRLVARVDVGFGRQVSFRGDAPPLDWYRGLWAWPSAADRWELVLSEPSAPFSFKALRDDTDWEQGPDHAANPGDTIEFQPTF